MVHLIKRGLQLPVSFTINSLDAAGGTAGWPPCRVSKMTTDVSAIGRGIWLGSILDGVDTWAPAWGEYGMVGVDSIPWPALGGIPPDMTGILRDGCIPLGRAPG